MSNRVGPLPLVPDHHITPADREQLRQLLHACFPEAFADRTYFKQVTPLRILARANGRIVGHVGIEHRALDQAGVPCRVLGVVDLAVDPDHRGIGLGRALLARVEEEARRGGLPFIILAADDARLYERAGYRRVDNVCRYVAIHDHHSIDVREQSLADCLMVRELGERRWRPGLVDFLGEVF